MKSLFFLYGALAALAAVKTDFEEEMKVDAGSDVQIPCSLKGPQVTWFWIPRYPICAGLKGDKEEKAIFTVISSGIKRGSERFQNRLTVENQNPDNISIITLRFLYMNDSGVFYCSAGKEKSPQTQVTVNPGYQNGIYLVENQRKSKKWPQGIKITCNVCINKTSANINRDDTIISWTLNGNSVPQGLTEKELRDTIIIKRHNRQYFGLWKCIRPSCLTQFDGYCLENDSETSRSDADVETTTVSTTDVTARANHHVIGGSIAGLLILLLVCVILFIICRRRHSHDVSPSGTREPETQESKELAGSEGSPQKRDGKEPGTEDHTFTEERMIFKSWHHDEENEGENVE
ncbi:uncharacterized protein LOC121922715 isoform X2 [Sceloporus undulatus]|uniref:uncharacterized protein LOC121922715 isoform X2 n=1 Tax=Sceloporus undulatus TaxID=8520 RepID=UPI001C4B4E95|nr:uncharacterized protein LOC121922715 isoform X2 [Sceloporus undulatus]